MKWVLLLAAVVCVARCSAPDDDQYYNFIPEFVGSFNVVAPTTLNFTASRCFRSIEASISADPSGASITLTAEHRKGLLCSDEYLVASRVHSAWYRVAGTGSHTFTYTWKAGEWDDVQQHGLQLFYLQDGVVGSIEDVLKTFALWLNTPKSIDANLQMLQERMDWIVQPRAVEPLHLPERSFRSGDQLAIFKLEADDGLIMWGTGSRTGHHTGFLWIDEQLYVVESCQSSCVGSQIGVQKTLWKEWMPRAIERNFSVAWLPLADEYSEAFNESAAITWFNSVEGLPYGKHNFFFGWVDTANLNYPPPLSAEFIIDALPRVDELIPALVSDWIGEALNFRLGTNGLNITQIYDQCDARNITVQQLFSMAEQDEWQYSDGYSMVCNVFWLELLKNGGVFGELVNQFQATEFTPKDTYQMNIYITDWDRPSACNSDSLPYCQLFGPYVVDLEGYSTRPLYANMSESCPSFPPKYLRSNHC